MFWEQLEASGLLAQLPSLLDSILQDMQTRMAVHASSHAGAVLSQDAQNAISIIEVLCALQVLQPCFLAAHELGTSCLMPAMQLGLDSLQYISTAMEQGGKQEWMEPLLRGSWGGLTNIASAAWGLLGFADQQVGGVSASSSAGSSRVPRRARGNLATASSSDTAGSIPSARSSSSGLYTGAAMKVLQSDQIMQWGCLLLAVPMVGQFLQQATPYASEQLLAVLAPSLPAAYSNMLEQLGISREVGLWLAHIVWERWDAQRASGVLPPFTNATAGWEDFTSAGVLAQLKECELLMTA
jgi:hypothetical protein